MDSLRPAMVQNGGIDISTFECYLHLTRIFASVKNLSYKDKVLYHDPGSWYSSTGVLEKLSPPFWQYLYFGTWAICRVPFVRILEGECSAESKNCVRNMAWHFVIRYKSFFHPFLNFCCLLCSFICSIVVICFFTARRHGKGWEAFS